jgi:hypothetical protein
VQGEQLVPVKVRNLWWYHSYWSEVKREDFHLVIREPLQEFCKQQLLEVIKRSVRALDGSSSLESLSQSQMLIDNPWIEKFIDSLAPELEALSIDPPAHLVQRVYALFDANEHGKITKQEFISKVVFGVASIL